jgi:hypothetical protein
MGNARPSLDEQDAKRREQDLNQTVAVLKALEDAEIVFNTKNFRVLAQPRFENEELYWKSMGDVLGFMRATADMRSVISGRLLYGLFNEAKPARMKVTDFEKPKVPFDTVLLNHVRRQLEVVRDITIVDAQQVIGQALDEIFPERLTGGVPTDFMIHQMQTRHEIFEGHANALCARDLFPNLSKAFEDETDATVQRVCRSAWLNVCAEKLVPMCHDNVFTSIITQIKMEMAMCWNTEIRITAGIIYSTLSSIARLCQMDEPSMFFTLAFSHYFQTSFLLLNRLMLEARITSPWALSKRAARAPHRGYLVPSRHNRF